MTTDQSRPVRFGVAVPQIFPDGIDLDEIRECVTHAEAMGYESLWVMESGIKRQRAARALEPLALLAYVAALTTDARLGTSVLIPAFRNPVQLATDLASLDQLSRGRLTVGVGVGHRQRASLFGVSPQGWTDRVEEGIEVLRRMWASGTATHHGRFWQFDDLAMEPKPLQQPHPPLWFGAKDPAALRRAVRLGTGWMGAGSSSQADFVRQVGILREILEETDRPPEDFVISKRIYLAIGDDVAGLESRVTAFFDHVYGRPEWAAQYAVWGPVEHCAERIADLIAAGAELVVCNPMFEHRAQLELLTEWVIPSLDL